MPHNFTCFITPLVYTPPIQIYISHDFNEISVSHNIKTTSLVFCSTPWAQNPSVLSDRDIGSGSFCSSGPRDCSSSSQDTHHGQDLSQSVTGSVLWALCHVIELVLSSVCSEAGCVGLPAAGGAGLVCHNVPMVSDECWDLRFPSRTWQFNEVVNVCLL